MMKTLSAALIGLSAWASVAQAAPKGSLTCQTRGFCTNDVSCTPDDAIMLVEVMPDGSATFGWEGQTSFSGLPLEKPGFTAYYSFDGPNAIQTLTLADDLTATMSVQTVIFDQLYHSIQSLTCVQNAS